MLKAAAGAATGSVISFGTVSNYESAASGGEQAIAFDPNNANKFAVAYEDDNFDWKLVVGEISGDSISYGTPVELFNQVSSCRFMDMDWGINGSIVVVLRYYNGSTYSAQGKTYTVSGTTPSGEHDFTFNSGNRIVDVSVACDPLNSGKFVIVFEDYSTGDLYYQVGSISGSVSLGSAGLIDFSVDTGETVNVKIDPTSSGRMIVAWSNGSNAGRVRAGTINYGSSSISFGSAVTFYATNPARKSIAFDPSTSNSFIVCGMNGGTGDTYCSACTLSGTAITAGTAVDTGVDGWPSVVFDPSNAGEFLLLTSISDSILEGSVSGTTITIGNETSLPTSITHNALAADSNTSGQFAAAFVDAGNSNYPSAVKISRS